MRMSTVGSQDPINPVDVIHLQKKLSCPNSKLASSWKKTLLYNWAKRQDKECPVYVPSRRARTLLCRTRLAGDTCTDCTRDRTNALTVLRSLRVDVKLKFSQCYGDSYGLTAGIKLDGHDELMWVDIVVMTLVVLKRQTCLMFPDYSAWALEPIDQIAREDPIRPSIHSFHTDNKHS